ncbi:MAG: hypothetical protein ABII27_00860 [bacterium]
MQKISLKVLYLVCICYLMPVKFLFGGQDDLRKSLEDDYSYYQRVVVPTGKQGKINFLKKLIKKYEDKGIDEMYIIPMQDELRKLQEIDENQQQYKTYEQNTATMNKEKIEASQLSEPTLNRNETILKIGIDISGKHKSDGTITYNDYPFSVSLNEDVKDGVSFTGEYISYMNDHFGLGGGITYQIPRKESDYDGKFNFIPIYGLFKLRTVPQTIDQPSFYFTGQLGYNVFAGDSDYKLGGSLDGGLYYGLGGGLQFKNGLLFELLYSVNNGSYEYSESGYDWYYGWYTYKEEIDIEYKMIRLSIGYAF